VTELDHSGLINVLENPPPVPRPIILPDFFLDHFIIADRLEDFLENLMWLAKQGGGNLLGFNHFIKRGGNAVNTASALLALELEPRVIVTTDENGASFLKTLVDPRLDLSLVHTDGRLSTTVSIEVEYEDRRVNLMISDSGYASEFSFSDLTESDLDAVKDSGLVSLVNLNHNRNAVDLAENLFMLVHNECNAITYMDIGDPSHNPHSLEPLTKKTLSKDLVDILGINENEATWLAWSISGRNKDWRKEHQKPEDWLAAAKYVAAETGVRVDFHTPLFSATLTDGEVINLVPAFIVDSKVICGAGDAWNAGNIYGVLLELSPDDRLTLANAVAAKYVASTDASHPSRTDIIHFLRDKTQMADITDKLLNSDSTLD
jgi:sugar/nucleoside kinase (ribokinase family)